MRGAGTLAVLHVPHMTCGLWKKLHPSSSEFHMSSTWATWALIFRAQKPVGGQGMSTLSIIGLS